jgi:hypothetical protein
MSYVDRNKHQPQNGSKTTPQSKARRVQINPTPHCAAQYAVTKFNKLNTSVTPHTNNRVFVLPFDVKQESRWLTPHHPRRKASRLLRRAARAPMARACEIGSVIVISPRHVFIRRVPNRRVSQLFAERQRAMVPNCIIAFRLSLDVDLNACFRADVHECRSPQDLQDANVQGDCLDHIQYQSHVQTSIEYSFVVMQQKWLTSDAKKRGGAKSDFAQPHKQECRYGSECEFAHDVAERRRPVGEVPYSFTRCSKPGCKDKACLFAHNDNEVCVIALHLGTSAQS